MSTPDPGRYVLKTSWPAGSAQWRTGELSMDIAMVVSNHPDLRARGEREGIAFVHLPVTADTKAAQEQRLLELVSQSGSVFE